MCANRAAPLLSVSVLALACSLAGCSHSGTRAEASKPVTPSIAYIKAWGMRGDGPGQLDGPTCIATDAVGRAYIADAGSSFIHKFDTDGTPLLSFQDLSLKQPQSIAVDSGGAIYVADPGSASAFVYLPKGTRYHRIGLKARPNRENILSIAVDVEGLIHILDTDAGHISTYTSRFRLMRSWQPAANVPNAQVRPRAVATGPDGSLYVADPEGNRIVKFTSEGHFLGDAVEGGANRRLSDEFAVSAAGIFAMDADGRILHVWSLDGKSKLDTDLAPELGQAKRPPPALALSPRKELLMLDAPEARVLRYRIDF
jgi:tripartite motif-containing protein 71